MGRGHKKRRGDDQPRASRLSVDLAAFRLAIGLVVVGGIVLFLAAESEKHTTAAVYTTVREVGALVFAAGVLSVGWELLGRRALTDEVLSAAELSSDVKSAGLRRIATHYLDVEWDVLLNEANHVDLFFTYARTWRNTHATGLRRLTAREGTRLRVVVPNRDNEMLMIQLAAKFSYTADELRSLIDGAEPDFANLSRQAAAEAKVELHRTDEFPVYSYYRLDRRCFAVLYPQAPGRVDVPTFECEQGGTLAAFFRGQFDGLWEGSSARPLA
jgi:hypothetical protein